jgi:hypothetical protein
MNIATLGGEEWMRGVVKFLGNGRANAGSSKEALVDVVGNGSEGREPLVEKGADLNAEDKFREMSMMKPAKNWHYDIWSSLFKKKKRKEREKKKKKKMAHIDMADGFGRTALIRVVEDRDESVM